jgi:hypothetical protein
MGEARPRAYHMDLTPQEKRRKEEPLEATNGDHLKRQTL